MLIVHGLGYRSGCWLGSWVDVGFVMIVDGLGHRSGCWLRCRLPNWSCVIHWGGSGCWKFAVRLMVIMMMIVLHKHWFSGP